MSKVFGIDPNQPVTPLMVRDAILECFFQAHCEDVGLDQDQTANKDYCQQIVKKAFNKAQADFDNPNKADIIKALSELKDFSQSFRDPEIIAKHAQQIMVLVNNIKE